MKEWKGTEIAKPTGKDKNMKTWYCVTSSFDNRGRVVAAITASKEAETCPESTYTSTSRKDIYNDWFGSTEEAQAWVEQARYA